MSIFVGGIRWIGLAVATLLLSFLLSGCHEGDFTFHLIQDTRIPAPEVAEVLEEIEAETGEACIDLNTADAETLQLIRHIGEQRAQQIIGLRTEQPFDGVSDITRVAGIGEIRARMVVEQGLVCP